MSECAVAREKIPSSNLASSFFLEVRNSTNFSFFSLLEILWSILDKHYIKLLLFSLQYFVTLYTLIFYEKFGLIIIARKIDSENFQISVTRDLVGRFV